MDVSAEADAFLQQLQSDAVAEPALVSQPDASATTAVHAPVQEQAAESAHTVPVDAAAPAAVGAGVSQPAPDAAGVGPAQAAAPAENGVGGDAQPDGAQPGGDADGSGERPRKRRNRWGAPAVEAEAVQATGADGQPKRKRRSRWEDPVENTETALANVLPKEIVLPGGIKVGAEPRAWFEAQEHCLFAARAGFMVLAHVFAGFFALCDSCCAAAGRPAFGADPRLGQQRPAGEGAAGGAQHCKQEDPGQ